MATKIFKKVSGLLVLLCTFATCVPLWAQPGSVSVVHTQCNKVLLTSDDSRIPLRLIEPYLQKREDFRASKLVLVDDEGSSEVIVRLRRSSVRGTSILVINLATGEHAIGSSPWTDYPGMIALDVMNEISQVCPGSIVAPPLHRQVLTAEHNEPEEEQDAYQYGFKLHSR